jgi:hypothetical protein
MALEPNTESDPCAGKTSVPTAQKEDERLDWDPSLVWALEASLPTIPDDDAYMRIALGGDSASAPPEARGGGTTPPANTPAVYPFIPAPTLEMERPEDHPRTAAAVATEPLAAADHRAADNAEDEPSTPTSTTATTRSAGTTPRTSPDGPADDAVAASLPDRGRWAAQDRDGYGDESMEQEEATCSVSYVRRVQSDGKGGPYHLLHGQIWRGSGDGKRPWRRHQWVVGG